MRWFLRGALAGSCLVGSAVYGGEWKVVPAIGLTERYSDNIALSPPPDAEGEFVTTISPNLLVDGVGRRVRADLNYRMEAIYYSSKKNSAVFHHLNSNIGAEITKDWFYVDAQATRSQQPVVSTDVGVLDNFSLTNDRTNVTTSMLSPYLRHEFGEGMSAEVRYSQSMINYSALQVSDSRVNKISAFIGDNQSVGDLGWALDYSQQQHDFDMGADSEFRRAELNLWYFLNSRLRLLLDTGREKIIFDSLLTSEEAVTEKSFWLAGLSWRPNARMLMEGQYGERFFGKSSTLRVKSGLRNANIGINYTEDITSVAVLDPEQEVDGRSSLMNSEVSSLNTEAFVRKKLTFNLDWSVERNTFYVTTFASKRNFQLTKSKEEDRGAVVKWTRNMARGSVATVEVGKKEMEIQLTGQKDELLTAEANVSIRLGRRLSSIYSYRRTERESIAFIKGYNVNVLGVSFKLTFP